MMTKHFNNKKKNEDHNWKQPGKNRPMERPRLKLLNCIVGNIRVMKIGIQRKKVEECMIGKLVLKPLLFEKNTWVRVYKLVITIPHSKHCILIIVFATLFLCHPIFLNLLMLLSISLSSWILILKMW